MLVTSQFHQMELCKNNHSIKSNIIKDAHTHKLGDKPGLSPSNRSLIRGIEILRAFRPGSDLLGNSEIAERTGLAKSTVSRLTQTLVGSGMLRLDPQRRAYRLAPATLSLAHAMKSGSRILTVAAPKMRELAERSAMNVGLAEPDRDDMIYLESIRYQRRIAFRSVVSGQRIPMELTSLGRAYLSTLTALKRKPLYSAFKARRTSQWQTSLRHEIESAIKDVHTQGFCVASWQPGVVAIATPLQVGGSTYALNVSTSTHDKSVDIIETMAKPLMKLRDEIQELLNNESSELK